MDVCSCLAHPRRQTWWRKCCTQGSQAQSTWWGTWPQRGQCRCHQSSTCSDQSLQLSLHDSPQPGSSSLQDPWEKESEASRGRKEVRQRERLDHSDVRGGQMHKTIKVDCFLTCVWSSSSPGIPWQRRSVWPCRAAPQRSPPPYHNLSSSPAGCHVACTLSRCRTEAPVCTRLWETQQLNNNYGQAVLK